MGDIDKDQVESNDDDPSHNLEVKKIDCCGQKIQRVDRHFFPNTCGLGSGSNDPKRLSLPNARESSKIKDQSATTPVTSDDFLHFRCSIQFDGAARGVRSSFGGFSGLGGGQRTNERTQKRETLIIPPGLSEKSALQLQISAAHSPLLLLRPLYSSHLKSPWCLSKGLGQSDRV